MANGLLNYYNQNGLLQDPSANIARQMTPQMQFRNPLLGMDLSPRQPTFGEQARTAAMGAARGLGNAFTGEGSSARLAALGASLLSGPSRTPISFGSSMAQGLLAGNIAAQQEEERKFKRGLLEQETALAKERLGIQREELDIEKQKLSPTMAVDKGPTTIYDKKGNPVIVKKFEDSLGNISYVDPSTKAKVDFTNYTLVEPKTYSQDFGPAVPYINKETGESEFIFEVKTNGQSSFERQNPDGSFEKVSLANYKKPISNEEKAAAIPTTKVIYEFAEEAMNTENSTSAVISFVSDLDKAISSKNFGLRGLVNKFTGQVKAATGEDLTEEEALRRLLSSKQAGIVGSSRIEILGPGVLSNQDIEFLFNAVGGKVDSLISDPRLMRDLLLQNYNSKIKSYKFQSKKYNANKEYLSEGDQPSLSPSFVLDGKKFNGFIDPDFFNEGGTTTMFMQMTPEEQKRVLIGFDNGR